MWKCILKTAAILGVSFGSVATLQAASHQGGGGHGGGHSAGHASASHSPAHAASGYYHGSSARYGGNGNRGSYGNQVYYGDRGYRGGYGYRSEHGRDFDRRDGYDHRYYRGYGWPYLYGYGWMSPYYGGSYYGDYSYPYVDYASAYPDTGYSGYSSFYAPVPEADYAYQRQPEAAGTTSRLTLIAPAGAEIWVNGAKLGGIVGTVPTYQTPAIEPGRQYKYTITAKWVEGGQPVTQSQEVVFSGGAGIIVRFPIDPSKPAA